MTKRVLVTGAGGYVGRSCLPVLVKFGYEVHAISRSRSTGKDNNVHWHKIDLLEVTNLTPIFNEIHATYLIHLGWYAEHGKFWEAPENRHWLSISKKLLDAFHKCGGKRVIVTGSCAEYDWQYGRCTEHKTPMNPSTLYGQCKHELYQYLKTNSGLEYAWARLFFLYGEDENPARLVSSVCYSLLNGEEAKISQGTQRRDFMHISDTAEALAVLLSSDYIGAINVASGQDVAVRDVVIKLAERIGRTDLLRIGAMGPQQEEPPQLIADTKILNEELGFVPSLSLNDGLDITVNFWKRKLGKN